MNYSSHGGDKFKERNIKMVTSEEIVEAIGKMKISELLVLNHMLEERFGIIVPTLSNTPVPQLVYPTEEIDEEIQTEFTVVLTSFGVKKIEVIKVVREVTALGLKEAKELVESAPCTIKENVLKETAELIKSKLEEIDASVEIR